MVLCYGSLQNSRTLLKFLFQNLFQTVFQLSGLHLRNPLLFSFNIEGLYHIYYLNISSIFNGFYKQKKKKFHKMKVIVLKLASVSPIQKRNKNRTKPSCSQHFQPALIGRADEENRDSKWPPCSLQTGDIKSSFSTDLRCPEKELHWNL